MGSYTTDLLLYQPGVGAPADNNTWGGSLNTDLSLLDNAIAGIQALTLTNANVTLTSNSGAADQARNAHFNLTGTLTGNILILWPQNLTRMFSVANNTTGSHTVTLGANNGSGSAAGTTQLIGQGASAEFVSDGTNITFRVTVASSTGTVTSVGSGTGLTGGPITTSGSLSLASIASGNVLANLSGGSAAPSPNTGSALLDNIDGSAAQGDVLYRGATTWGALAHGTSGQFLQTTGAASNPVWASLANIPLTALAAQASDTFVMNATGGSAAPTAASVATALTTLGFTSGSIASGYYILPGGLTIEWGTTSSIGSGTHSLAITLPLALSTAIYAIAVTPASNTGTGGMAYYYTSSQSTTGFTLTTAAASSATYYWIVLGS